MINFLPVRADIKNNLFENVKFLPFIVDLIFKNRHFLVDDSFPKDDSEFLDYIIDEINSVYPWFLIVTKDNEALGAAWITHWHRGEKRFHSCQLHGCIDKKYFGEPAAIALKDLIKFLYKNTGVKRIQMEIPEYNSLAINFAKKAGFEEEGLIKCAALKNGISLNHVLLGKVLN